MSSATRSVGCALFVALLLELRRRLFLRLVFPLFRIRHAPLLPTGSILNPARAWRNWQTRQV
jgi:hypothetical protein